jgi:diadenylate cyclase
MDNLEQYIETGVRMDVTPELLLQIFYPDTPLHDGGHHCAGTHRRRGVCNAFIGKRHP